jgi:hypothetical protein
MESLRGDERYETLRLTELTKVFGRTKAVDGMTLTLFQD